TSPLNPNLKITYSKEKEGLTIRFYSIISHNESDKITREILSFFQRRYSKTPFIIENFEILSESFIIYFTHIEDKRLHFSKIDDFKFSQGIMSLTTKIDWDRKKQPMGLVVGPTNSGKTTFLKMLIISFLSNNSKNSLYTIDGKYSFLSVATSYFFSSHQTATSSNDALRIVTELNEVMNERYKLMNKHFEDEKDETFDDKFRSGSILLVVDELLSLVSEMQASDRQLKPAERLYPQFYSKLLSLIVKGRGASINVIVSGQMIPVTILPSEARDSLGFRCALGRISQSQATEIFGESVKDLPKPSQEYSGLIWLDGLAWQSPKVILTPHYDEDQLPFKQTLLYLKNNRT
ncbi:MAG: FtsK/SpoIIIE domain-containing protein, partial [Carnobacterium sp.]